MASLKYRRYRSTCWCIYARYEKAGMANTGKHFPGHGSVKPIHMSQPQSIAVAMTKFITMTCKALSNMPELDALMPAHVIYDQVDPNPAGFSPFWIQEVLRNRLKFNGVLFSDDLSMQAACVAGVQMRVFKRLWQQAVIWG